MRSSLELAWSFCAATLIVQGPARRVLLLTLLQRRGPGASRSSVRGGTSGLRGCVCAWGAGVHGLFVQQRKTGAGYFVLQCLYGYIIRLSALALIFWFKPVKLEIR